MSTLREYLHGVPEDCLDAACAALAKYTPTDLVCLEDPLIEEIAKSVAIKPLTPLNFKVWLIAARNRCKSPGHEGRSDANQELQKELNIERQKRLVAEGNARAQARSMSNYLDKGKALKERLDKNPAHFETFLSAYDEGSAQQFLAGQATLVADWRRMLENKNMIEDDVQVLVGRLLTAILATRCEDLGLLYHYDTSDTPLVGGAKPDIILADVEGRPCAAHAVTIFELKKDLSTDRPLDDCRGQLEYRVFQLEPQQPYRLKFVFVAMGRKHIQVLEFPRDGLELIKCLPEHDFALEANSAGFQDLWRLLHTPSESLGYRAPMLPSSIQMPEGKLSFQAALMASATRSQDGSPLRATTVYLGKLTGGGPDPRTSRPKEVVVKFPGTHAAFLDELCHLQLVTDKDWPTIRLVGTVRVNGMSGLVLEPVGRAIGFGIGMGLLRKILRQAASFVGDYCNDAKKYHRDLSLQNLAITEDGNVLVLDFQTSCSVDEEYNGDPTGTRIFMALSIMRGQRPSVSSELESLAYVALDVLTAHHLPWRGSTKTLGEDEAVAREREVEVKLRAMQNFELVQHVREDGKVFAHSLRNLFFGRGYREDVTVDEFKSCCL